MNKKNTSILPLGEHGELLTEKRGLDQLNEAIRLLEGIPNFCGYAGVTVDDLFLWPYGAKSYLINAAVACARSHAQKERK